MSLWYCPKCNDYRGPCPANVCPTCGTAMSWATMREPQVVPARVQSVEPAPGTGSALGSSSSSSPLDLTPIRARLNAAMDGTVNAAPPRWTDLEALVAEVDHLRAELARERQHSADLRSALTALRDQWRAPRGDRTADFWLERCAADLDACLHASQEGS